MRRVPNFLPRAVLLALAVILAAAGLWAWQTQREPASPVPAELASYLYWQPAELSDFALRSSGDRTFGSADLRGKWTLVLFGYLSCPDICPATLAVLADAYRRVEQAPDRASLLQTLFVSVDPQRDSPDQLASYVAYFHPRFIGATGKPEALEALARQLDAPFAVQKGPQGPQSQGYQVAHSATVFLVDPAGRLFARFPPPQSADEIAEVFPKLRADYEKGKKSRWAWF